MDSIIVKMHLLTYKYYLYIESIDLEVSDLFADNPFVKQVLRITFEII